MEARRAKCPRKIGERSEEGTAEDVDAVLDLEYVAERSTKATAAAAAQALASVSAIGPWRSITLSTCAFPASLAGKSVVVHHVVRKDWEIYLAAKAHVSKSMSLIFGDYGVSNVEAFEGDPRTMNMSVNLRYTHDVNWFVYKGRSAKDHGIEQYRDLCKILVTSNPPFMGHLGSYLLPCVSCAWESPGPLRPPVWQRSGPSCAAKGIVMNGHQFTRVVGTDQVTHPGEDGDVSDGVRISHDPVAGCQARIQYA